MSLIKKCIAEAIGTFVLVFFAVGTAIASGGNYVATALAFGLVIVAMAYSIGRISGCHINPAVSLGCLIAGRMSVKDFLCYVAAQIVGGLLGAVVLFGIAKMGCPDSLESIMEAELATAGSNFAYGVNATNADMGAGNIFATLFLEIILTCIFVYVILNVTDENSGAGKKAGIIIGFTLALVHLIGIGFDGTSVNPARSIATAFANLFFGGDADYKSEALKEVWLFIVGPMAGGALAALLFKGLHGKKEAE